MEAKNLSRRRFLEVWGAACLAAGARCAAPFSGGSASDRIHFGLVTYQWGKDWDLPTLLRYCEATGALGVELRTTHAHGVEPELSPSQREDIRKRFADSPVTCLGPGSNERFDHPDPEALEAAKERTREFLRLSHDIGASGVKVKPNSFHPDVPRARTLEQIGTSLNELGPFAADLGQEIRLEVHGDCAPPPIMRQIMEIATHPAVVVCWNSNPSDLEGAGLEENFALLQNRLGHTIHARDLDSGDYPYQRLIQLLVQRDYSGWLLIEASGQPADPVQALVHERRVFERMLSEAAS